MWRRRRFRIEDIPLGPPPDEFVRVLSPPEAEAASRHPAFNAASAVTRIERFVASAAASIAQLEDRLAQLEGITHRLSEEVHSRATHHDLLDVRLHASRVDADVKRLATELRAEVDEIKLEGDLLVDGRSAAQRRRASIADDLDLRSGEAS